MTGPGEHEKSHTVTLIDDETGNRFVLPVLKGTTVKFLNSDNTWKSTIQEVNGAP